MTTPTFTSPPTAPDRLNAAFSSQVSAFLSWMTTYAGETDEHVTWTEAQVTWTQAQVIAVQGYLTATQAAANAAEVSAGAVAHVPDAAYEAGAKVWSNVDFQTYRAKTTHSDVATDPSADKVNWVGLTSPDEVAAELSLHSLWTGA